jgi:tetratricopeptide (TPR) repeat protein
MESKMITKKDIVKYYIAMFDRIPEKESIDNWYNVAITQEWQEKDLVSSLFTTAVDNVNNNADLANLYPQYKDFDSKSLHSVISVIENVYKSLFDKTLKDDPNGIVNWSIKIIINDMSISDAIMSIEHYAEDVYNGKVNLKDSDYSDEEINHIETAVNIYEDRVEFASKVSNVIDNIKNDDDSFKLLQDGINMVHSKDDYDKAISFLENNIDKIVPENESDDIANKLKNIFIVQNDNKDLNSLLESSENLGFIDLPNYSPNIEAITDIHYI